MSLWWRSIPLEIPSVEVGSTGWIIKTAHLLRLRLLRAQASSPLPVGPVDGQIGCD